MSRLALLEPHAATIDRLTNKVELLRAALARRMDDCCKPDLDGRCCRRCHADSDLLHRLFPEPDPLPDHPVPWSGSPGLNGEKCGPVSDADVMPKVNGQTFRCDCGCNVFRTVARQQHDAANETRYRCNSCRAVFVGTAADADPLPWEAGPPNAAHAAADAAMFLDDGDYEE